MSHEHKPGERCMICEEGMAAFRTKMESLIERVGWGVIGTPLPLEDGHMTHMLYTVGLGRKGLPEIVLLNVPFDVGLKVVNDVTDRFVEGLVKIDEEFPAASTDRHENLRGILKRIPQSFIDEHMQQAKNYSENVTAVQLVVASANNKFSWEEGCDPAWKELEVLLFTQLQ